MFKNFSQKIQQFGRTLLLPIAVMAPVGMILGITGALVQSYMIARFPFLWNPVVNTILVNLRTIAGAVFDNIPLMFAMGVAYGMSKKDKGISVFASVIGYIILIISMNVWLVVSGKSVVSSKRKVSGARSYESIWTNKGVRNTNNECKRFGRNYNRINCSLGNR